MATRKRIVAGDKPIEEFELFVQDLEASYGPLIAMTIAPIIAPATTETHNEMTVRVADVPENLAVLRAYTAQPPAVEGAVLFCVGRCLVDGAPTLVAAYRPG